MRPHRILVGLLIVLLAAPSPLWADELTPQRRLAGQFVRAAAMVIEAGPLTVKALDGAVLLARQAVSIDPDNPEAWRTLCELAALAERGDLHSAAVAQLVRLDPHDEVVRLRYLNEAIGRYQTVEDRIGAYERLLSQENRRKLGPVVASRLAMDLALLLYRQGDVEAYAEWLAEAVSLDSANRTAVATAAGFFRMNVDDPFAEAELLTTLVLADPTDVDTQAALAQLLLEHGAYVGADRLYSLAMRTRTARGLPPASGLLADRAVAQWGRGDAEAALRSIHARQREIDTAHRRKLRQEDPQLTPLELARRHAPLAGTLATVKAAIHNRLGDDQAGPTLRNAIAAYESEIQTLLAEDNPDAAELAQRYLEAAWVALWLADETGRAASFLQATVPLLADGELNEAAKARFDGWLALRQGELQRAADLLKPFANDDSAARLGLAVAQLRQGRRRDAAWELLALARRQPGTLMGVWAADVLAELVGRRTAPSEQAARMERLIASIPSVVDRFPDEPTLAVSVRLIPAKTTFDPYEPIIINLEIRNNAPFPLAIDGGGPIRPHVALVPTAQISRAPQVSQVRPLIVDINRRLRLEPHGQLVVPVDLRRSVLDQVLNALPLRGATLKVVAVTNFVLTPSGVIRPGILGSEVETAPFRVDGARTTPQWFAQAITAILEPDSPHDLQTMGLLGHGVEHLGQVLASRADGTPGELTEEARAELTQLAADTSAGLAEAYPKLDAASQAWLLAVMPRGEVLEPLLAMARKSEEKLVRISYLLYHVTDLDDPMLDAAKRGNDPDVRGVAELVEFGLSRQAARPDQ